MVLIARFDLIDGSDVQVARHDGVVVLSWPHKQAEMQPELAKAIGTALIEASEKEAVA